MTGELFKNIFDLYFEEIRRYIFFRCGNAALADDIAQQTFLIIWEKQMNFLPGKEKSLLYKIAGDEFIDGIRRKKLEIDFIHGFSDISENITPDKELELKELNQTFLIALEKMKENQRVVFLMSRKEGLKYYEISERLNLSIKAVEKRMKGALDLLKKELKKE